MTEFETPPGPGSGSGSAVAYDPDSVSLRSADSPRRLAASAGLILASAVLLFLGGLLVGSLAAVRGSLAFAGFAIVILATATFWSAWRTVSWRALILVSCPLLMFPVSLRLAPEASALGWLLLYVGSSVALAFVVGLAAVRSPTRRRDGVALSVSTAFLLGLALVLALALLWGGDLN